MVREVPPPLAGVRVLIVEDEYLLADDLAYALRAAGAEPVGPVATIAQAEARIAASPFDAAILDMNLRGETAFALAERMLADHVPSVVVSGYSEQALPASIAGMRRLEKPVNATLVVAALNEELTSSRAAKGPAVVG